MPARLTPATMPSANTASFTPFSAAINASVQIAQSHFRHAHDTADSAPRNIVSRALETQ